MAKTSAKSNGLISHFHSVIASRSSNGLSCFNYDIALKHVKIFTDGNEVPFASISNEWFKRFHLYLDNANGLRSEKLIGNNSANTYFRIVLSIAKDAADERLIDHKAISQVRVTSREKSEAECLSSDELQLLANTPCRVPILRQAFLFSCLTGLQWSEIKALKWSQLKIIEGVCSLDLKRNECKVLMPLNEQAKTILGIEGSPADRIFKLHYSAALCVTLNQWALQAGILRNITFHVARQTFGKLLLEKDVPIELVSELLGHRHIKTTQKLYGLPTAMLKTRSYLRTFNI